MSGAWLRIAGGAGLAAAAAALSYPWLFRRPCLTWGATPEEAARELPGDGLLANPDIIATRHHDRRAAGRRVALAGPDGQRPRRRLHLRLDREPVRPRHAQRRRDPAAVPGPEAGGRAPAGAGPPDDAGRGLRARAGAVAPLRGPQLGVDLRAGSRRWPDQVAEQEPDRDAPRVRAHPAGRSAGHGARKPGDGAEDAAGDQGTGAAPGGRARPA